MTDADRARAYVRLRDRLVALIEAGTVSPATVQDALNVTTQEALSERGGEK